ncbi:MAG TPA: hypothetical protein VFW21_15870, partial [Mycobacterium sp.]|nr:hypothetical protein [Mycobacterium sp.]
SDLDRAKWTVANAPTKDRAEAARDELAARGIDLANPPDRTTAAEWVQAHRAEQVVEDSVRAVTDEIDLVDPQRDADQAAMDAVSPVTGPVEETGVVETAVADIRDTAEADAGEHTDPDERRRVPPLAETRETVERAQEAVAELAAREVLDEAADTPELGGAVARWDDGTDDVRDHTMGNEIPEVVVPDVPDYQDADA